MEKPRWTKINKQLVHEVVIRGAPRIQLVARATGWQSAASVPTPAFAGALVNIAPEAVLVQHEDREERVLISDPERTALGGILMAALAVSTLCWLIMWIATRLITPRKMFR